MPVASQSAGGADSSQLVAMLKPRVTNDFPRGAMPLARSQPTRTLMFPALCVGSSVWCRNIRSNRSLHKILLLQEENPHPDLPSCEDFHSKRALWCRHLKSRL